MEFKGWREHGETRNEEKKKTNKNKKNEEQEKYTQYSRQRGEIIKNTAAQIKTEAGRGGSQHLECKMLQLQRG